MEKDVKVKERMLLVLNVVYHGKIAAQVAEREAEAGPVDG